jgi:hypothetical protein
MEGSLPTPPPPGEGTSVPPAATPGPPAPPPAPRTDVIEKFPLLDRESRRRRETDIRLSYAMYLVVGFFTFGIYAIYIHFKLIQRQQEHFARMARFNEDLYGVIEGRAENIGATQAYGREIEEIRLGMEDFHRLQRGKERNPALWTIIGLITLGLGFLYVLWFLNADLVEHQRAEADYIEKAGAVLNKLGIGKHPVIVEQVVPDRSFPLYLLFTVITLGLFELYWAYVRIKDPNDHFSEHDRWEDQLVSLIRANT